MSGLINNKVDYFMNPSTNAEIYVEENKDEVVKYLAIRGVSYPSEISRVTQIHIEGVNKILNYFIKMGFIERITPDQWNPQVVFKYRLPEFMSIGIDSYEKVMRCSWWILSLGGFEYLKEKYRGKQVHISTSLIKQMELLVDGKLLSQPQKEDEQ